MDFTQWEQILFSFIVLTLFGFIVTWYFASYLHLGWWELFSIFTFLLFAQNMLVNYFLPFRLLEDLAKNLNFLQLFGFAFISASSGLVNYTILYYRFGLQNSLMLVLAVTLLGNGLGQLISQM